MCVVCWFGHKCAFCMIPEDSLYDWFGSLHLCTKKKSYSIVLPACLPWDFNSCITYIYPWHKSHYTLPQTKYIHGTQHTIGHIACQNFNLNSATKLQFTSEYTWNRNIALTMLSMLYGFLPVRGVKIKTCLPGSRVLLTQQKKRHTKHVKLPLGRTFKLVNINSSLFSTIKH